MLPDGSVPLTIAPARPPADGKRPLAFVDVDAPATPADEGSDGPGVAPVGVPGNPAGDDPSWSLWGDLEG
jgi:hypothetical protein